MNRIARLYNWYRKQKFQQLSTYHIKGEHPTIVQPVMMLGEGNISFGKNVTLGWYQSPGFFSGYFYMEARYKDSSIFIDENVYSNNNLSIICEASVTIGRNTLIGYNVEILDSDFHGLKPEERRSDNQKRAPVIIEENVFIGNNVKILKGVSIGKNSVIANGAIVTQSFGENLIIGGIPAKVIGTL